MTSLYIALNGGTRVKSFSSASRGGRSTVKIELDVPDPHELGWMLEELSKAQRAAAPARPARKAQLLLEHRREVGDD